MREDRHGIFGSDRSVEIDANAGRRRRNGRGVPSMRDRWKTKVRLGWQRV